MNQQVEATVALAKSQVPESEIPTIKQRWKIGVDDLLFEFLKIAYEMWFRRFGYPWVEDSHTALKLRSAIMGRDTSFPLNGMLAEQMELPGSDPLIHHQILEIGGSCSIRLFHITCYVQCEESDLRFMHPQED